MIDCINDFIAIKILKFKYTHWQLMVLDNTECEHFESD